MAPLKRLDIASIFAQVWEAAFCLCSSIASGIGSLSVDSTHSSAALLLRQRRKEKESKQADKVKPVDGLCLLYLPAGVLLLVAPLVTGSGRAETQTRRHSNLIQLGRDHSSAREPHLGGTVGPTQMWRGRWLRDGVADPRQGSGLRGRGSAEGQKRGCLATSHTNKTTSYFSGNTS